jgi:hypothetical protein
VTDVELSALSSEAVRMSRAWSEVRAAASEVLAIHDEHGPSRPPSDTGPVRLRLEQALTAVKPRLTSDELEAVATLARLTDATWLHEIDRQAAVTVVRAIRRVAG